MTLILLIDELVRHTVAWVLAFIALALTTTARGALRVAAVIGDVEWPEDEE